MARSYKSALPTWSTYTPHVNPLGGIQPAMNQEVLWRNRARQWVAPSTAGQYNRFASEAAGMVRGTGSAGAVAGMLTHRPIFNSMLGAMQGGLSKKQQSQVNQATQPVDPLPAQPAQPATGAQPPRKAASKVNPINVATQQAAQGGITAIASQAIKSRTIGTSTGPATMLPGANIDQMNQYFKTLYEP